MAKKIMRVKGNTYSFPQRYYDAHEELRNIGLIKNMSSILKRGLDLVRKEIFSPITGEMSDEEALESIENSLKAIWERISFESRVKRKHTLMNNERKAERLERLRKLRENSPLTTDSLSLYQFDTTTIDFLEQFLLSKSEAARFCMETYMFDLNQYKSQMLRFIPVEVENNV